jgi:1D-myo-inositol-tetrakisphosphate 5-kinase/inositol-polyphosphate multikinase
MASTSTIIRPLESQVGGHPGVFTTENESLLIKPAVPNELAVYQRLQQDSNLEDLRAFTPTFLGTLKLIGKIDEAGSAASESIVFEPVASEEKDESFALVSILVSPDTIFCLSTIHCSRKSLILFPQT